MSDIEPPYLDVLRAGFRASRLWWSGSRPRGRLSRPRGSAEPSDADEATIVDEPRLRATSGDSSSYDYEYHYHYLIGIIIVIVLIVIICVLTWFCAAYYYSKCSSLTSRARRFLIPQEMTPKGRRGARRPARLSLGASALRPRRRRLLGPGAHGHRDGHAGVVTALPPTRPFPDNSSFHFCSGFLCVRPGTTRRRDSDANAAAKLQLQSVEILETVV